MKFLISLLTLLCSLNIFALNIKCRILDENKKPLSDAVISTKNQLTVSDSMGFFSYKIENGDPQITIKKMSFSSLKTTQSELLKNKRLILKRNSIPLRGTVLKEKNNDLAQQIRSDIHIDKTSIEDKTTNSIADWLKNEQGIYIKGNELPGEKKSISLGGHSAKHTVVILDGVVLNPSGQEVDLSTVLNSQIESIEIVKNNASVESGSGAIAGLIIIKTASINKKEFASLESMYGSFSSQKQTLLLSKKLDNIFLSASLSEFTSQNDFKFYNRLTNKMDTRKDNAKASQNFSLNLNIGKKYIFNLQSSANLFKNHLPGTYNYPIAFKGSFIKGYSLKNSANLKYPLFSLNNEFTLYNLYDNNSYKNLKAPVLIYRSDTDNKQSVSGFKHTSSKKWLKDKFEIKTAFEYKNEQFSSVDILKPSATMKPDDRNTFSGVLSSYINHDVYLFSLSNQSSVRIDYNKEFKDNYSWRTEQKIIYGSYIPLEFTASLGKAYMLPSFFDLYWKGDSQITGNQNLKPEKSLGFRTSLKIGDNPSLEQSYWLNDTENLIYWFRSLSAWKPGNISKARIQNYETTLKYNLDKYADLSLSYTKTDSKDKSLNPDGSHSDFYNKYLIYTPLYQWHGSLQNKYSFISHTLEFTASGKQYSTRDQLIQPVKAYKKWDSHTSFSFKKFGMEEKINLSFLNIFNEKYEIYDYTPEAGFHWQIMLKLSKNI